MTLITHTFMFLAFAALTLACGQRCMDNPSTFNFKIGGKYDAMIVADGPVLIDEHYFNVPDAAVQSSYASLHRAVAPVTWQQNIVVIDAPIGRVMIDTGAYNTGIHEFRNGGNLIPNLRSAGVSPDSIDYVLLTHGHADHVAGMLRQHGARRFENAKVYMPRIEHQYWMNDSLTNADSPDSLVAFQNIYQKVVKAYRGRYTLVNDGETPIQGFKFTLRPGHTPGHMVIEVTLGGERIVVIGDAWFSHPDQVRHPEWVQPFETDGVQSYFSRVQIMSDLVATGDKVVAFHEDFPGIGHIIKTAYGYDWIDARAGTMGTVRKVCRGGRKVNPMTGAKH